MSDEDHLSVEGKSMAEAFGRLIAVLQVRGVIEEEDGEFIMTGDQESLQKVTEKTSNDEMGELLEKYSSQ